MTHIFIVNPCAGQKTFADDLRTKLADMKGLNYFVFNTRYAGYETELVQKIQHIFDGEKLRFYCCGGSGTMRNMLDGFQNLAEAEVAFFPCGLSNDFLKVFGKEESRFHQIEELIDGDVIKVDYIQTNHGVALNTVSTGLDSDSQVLFEKYRMLSLFNEQIPYKMSLLCSLFLSRPVAYDIYIDRERVEGSFAEIFLGNGNVLGGSLFFEETACVNDGVATCRLFPNLHGFPLLPIVSALQSRNNDKLKAYPCFHCRQIRVSRKDGAPFCVNLDGELVRDINDWSARVVHGGLQLVVPKGVRL